MSARTNRVINTTTYGILGLAALGAFALPGRIISETNAQPMAGPVTIRVPGIIRDFRRDHPDFNVKPVTGYGHYAGNVSTSLEADFIPRLQTGGYRVALEWLDTSNQPIAPHLAQGVSPIQIASTPRTADGVTIDSYDPDVGAYGDDNVGPAPNILVGSAMPTIVLPTGLGPSIGNFVMTNDPETVSTSFVCDSFSTRDFAIMLVSGDVIIHCLGDFSMQQQSRIDLLPGASLKIYVGGSFRMFQGSMLNINTLDPRLCYIFNDGEKQNDISQYSEVCATFISPNASLELGQDVQFYGTFIGSTIDMRQSSGFHSAGLTIADGCGVLIKDRFGAPGAFATGGITSANTYDQWYHDYLGTNLSQIHTIDLVLNGAGVYEAFIPGFHPIDDRLLGNENDRHNYFFTYELQANIAYDACQSQFFEFKGSDDFWLYIDGKLAIDLGGVIPGTNQVVELDRLNLTDGQTYQIKIFYAQRQGIDSRFNLRTNLKLIPPFITMTGTGGYD